MADKGEPQVSVLMPFRDAEATLPQCLQSIRRQTFPDWECVAVDDHSSDRSLELVREAAASDSRIQVVRGTTGGLVPALNQGLALCSGRYVARMDGDDLMHRDRLAHQVAMLESDPGLAGLGCRVRMFPRKTLGPGMAAYEAWLNRIDSPERLAADLWIECPVAHPALMLHSGVFKEAGYRDKGWPEDYDLILRLLGAGRKIGVAPQRLLSWRRDPGSLSMTDPRYRADRFAACKAEHLCTLSAIGFLHASHRYLLWGYGGTGRSLARELQVHGRYPSAIIDVHPGRIDNRILGAAVIGPEDLPEPGTLPMVVSVAGEEPRGRIRAFLNHRGWRESLDFICAA